jgi:hypothetical protein
MGTFDEIREEVSESYESNRVKKNEMPSLTNGRGRKHNGHEGMSSYHASMADKYKGSEAGKHHQRASDHHMRALSAIRKGNINGGLTHARNALDAAKAAHDSHNSPHSEAGKSDSMKLYHDHKGAANSVKQAKRRDDEYNQRSKPTRSDKPIQRAIGKTKSKIKKVLRMGEDVEQVATEEGKMKSFHDLLGELEEAKNAAQQAAIAIAKKEKGEKPKDESMDRDALNKAMAAFKKKGGKVTKVPAAKAQGYHGKDDPGSQVHGVLDRPDTKKFKAKKGGKIRSMGSLRNQTEGIVKQTHMFDNEKDARAKAKEIGGKYVKGTGKSAGKHAAVGQKLSLKFPKKNPLGKPLDLKKMNPNRASLKRVKRSGIDEKKLMKGIEKDKPPFDNAKPANKDPKDRFGNPIKNRARHLARKAAKGMVGEKKLMKGIEVDDDTLRMFKANPKLVPNSAVFRRLDPKTQNAVKKHLGM